MVAARVFREGQRCLPKLAFNYFDQTFQNDGLSIVPNGRSSE